MAVRDRFSQMGSGSSMYRNNPRKERNENMSVKNIKNEVMESVTEGLKIGAATQASELLLDGVKKFVGDSYPEFLKTPMGEKLANYLVPVAVLALCEFFGDRVPAASTVKPMASRALTGFAASDARELTALAKPLLEHLASTVAVELPQDCLCGKKE